MNVIRAAALAVPAIPLAACNGSNNGLGDGRFSAIEAGSVARALDDGKTLSS